MSPEPQARLLLGGSFGWARRPLGLRDKAIQYLQEHIWQRGSTINLPPFNTPSSRLAAAASSQQFLEAAIALPSQLLPAGMGIRAPSTHTRAWPGVSGSFGLLVCLSVFSFSQIPHLSPSDSRVYTALAASQNTHQVVQGTKPSRQEKPKDKTQPSPA